MTDSKLVLPELLAPAGSSEAFRAAVAAGADAIYCGVGNDFNARRSAHNFDLTSFAEACEMAHLAGVRVYVTINIVIQQQELMAALTLIRNAWLAGADAFIIQDWGLLELVRRLWPQVECHISTQANVHDARATLWAHERGATRATLSRELSLEEISACAATGVEVECFGHGAICFCYSGVCLLSSMSGGRSANRGMCAQPCRLPYDLVDEKGHSLEAPGRERPLCPKDMCTIDDIEALARAHAGSLKIEGRMKAPDYVYSVVRAYRAQMDDIAAGVEPAERDRRFRQRLLERSFNRGLTDAYLRGISDDELMSYERSNNRGQLIGSVVSSRKLDDVYRKSRGTNGGRERTRKITRASCTIKLNEPVGKGDLVEMRPDDEPATFLCAHVEADAAAGTTITVECARPMPKGCPVRLIRSQEALDAAARLANLDYVYHRPVDVSVVCQLGKPLQVILTTQDGTQATSEGPVVEPARTKALTQADVAEHVGRMGATPFEPNTITVELDQGCGMGFATLHKVRAAAAETLSQALLAPYKARTNTTSELPHDLEALLSSVGLNSAREHTVAPSHPANKSNLLQPTLHKMGLAVVAPTPELAELAFVQGADRVYVDSDALGTAEFDPRCIPLLDEICREVDHERFDQFMRSGATVAAGNVSQLVQGVAVGATVELRPTIPVHNSACLSTLEDAGAELFWLSPELSLLEIECLAHAATVPLGVSIYGAPRVMTSEHCVLQAANACIHDCARCGLRRRHLSLKNIDGELFPVTTDIHGRSRIYAARPTDAIPLIGRLRDAGISWVSIDATLLSAAELTRQIQRARRAMGSNSAAEGMRREPHTTSGHFFEAIS